MRTSSKNPFGHSEDFELVIRDHLLFIVTLKARIADIVQLVLLFTEAQGPLKIA